MRRSRKLEQRGNALIEFALVSPWFFLLFSGVMQAGFTIYGLISVQNAARVAVLHLAANPEAASDQAGACSLVIQQLRGLPQIGSSFSSNCTASPIVVTARYCDSTVACSGTATSADNGPAAFVSVTYSLPQMLQFPVGRTGSITRTMELRLRDPLP